MISPAIDREHFVTICFRTSNIDEELTVVRKTERDKETYKLVCFLAEVITPAAYQCISSRGSLLFQIFNFQRNSNC